MMKEMVMEVVVMALVVGVGVMKIEVHDPQVAGGPVWTWGAGYISL